MIGPDAEAIVGIFTCVCICIFLYVTAKGDAKARKDYRDGWNDCRYIMEKLDEEIQEEDVLKYLKKATELLVRDTAKYQRGDFKEIGECRDIKELQVKVKEILDRK